MIPARVSVITIGTLDFERMRDFYIGLGWPVATRGERFVMFNTSGGVLALFPLAELAADANVGGIQPHEQYSGFSTAINLESREQVDATFAELIDLGVTVTREPEETFWGGYGGYFADPEGNLWEVVWNPYVRFDQRGALDMNISL